MRFLSLILVAGVFLPGIPALAQAPAVPNADFMQGEGEKPGDWEWETGEGGKGEFAWVHDDAHKGTRAVRIRKIGYQGYTARTSDFITVEPETSYEVSAWVKPLTRVRRGVYFMVTQHLPDDDANQYPNSFSRTDQILQPGRWQRLSHVFEVRPGNTRIRIHCLQAFAPSEVLWDDFALVLADETTAPAARFEPPPAEEIQPLEPALTALAQRPRASAHIEMRGARPRLIVDGAPTPFAWYVGPFGADFAQRAQITDFARAGVHVYLVPLVLGRGMYGDRGPWLGENQWDFSEVDELILRVLRNDPQGYVIFYMACDPYPDWGRENPEHVTWDQHGEKAVVQMHTRRWGGEPEPGERFGPSAMSPKFRADVAETLRRLVAHVESSQAGKAVIGYHVAGLNDGQWFPWERLDPNDLHLSDYSPGAQEGFRLWLRERYNDDVAALRTAWNDPAATFFAAAVPPPDKLWNDQVFLDPQKDGHVIDWLRFYSEGVAETVQYLAGVLKSETPRPIICGTYYEDITCNIANHIALAGHLASPHMDFLAGPAAYGVRMAGYQGTVRNVFGSTVLHGKMYLTEQDWRSWRSYPNQPEQNFSWGRAETAEIHNAMVRRECGMMLAYGLGTWWYDMSGGWFRDDGIMAGITEAVQAFRRELDHTEAPGADVAVFVSEESNYHIGHKSAGVFRYNGIVKQIQELNLAGVPYRLYLQSDFGTASLPEYKLYLFLNPYHLDETQLQAIADLKTRGATLAFIQAPGIIGAPDPAQTISEITGMGIRPFTGDTVQYIIPTDDQAALPEGTEPDITWSAAMPGPLFAVDDPQASVLGYYGETDQAGAAVRSFDTWQSAFVGTPGITAAFFNRLARWAGAWVAAEPGDAVYASERFLTVHGIFPGRKVIHLRHPARVTDLTSGEVISEPTDTVEFELDHAHTRWFYLEP